MNHTLNDSFKKDLPNLHAWCEEYVQKTGIRVFAGNPPVGLVLEHYMGKFNAYVAATDLIIEGLTESIEKLSKIIEKNKVEKKTK